MSNIDKDWLELTIVTSSEAIEAVTGILYNTAVKGVSILDPDDIEFKKKHPGDWDYFDEELLKIKDDAIVKGYFKDDENFEDYVKYIKDSIEKLDEFGLDKGKGLVTVNKVNEEDWENNWKKYYKPTKVGDRIVVRPVWEEYTANENELVISLDPGMAFGTGTHETTRMCVKAIEKYVKNDSRVFDIGTGSGILAISAAKMNASEVIGVDLDPVAVDSARSNLKFNDVDNIKILHGNLMDVVEGKADIVVANIIAEIIMILTADVKKFIKNGGYFISSGIIKDRKQDVMNKLQECGFEIIEANEDGEWVCIVAQMK